MDRADGLRAVLCPGARRPPPEGNQLRSDSAVADAAYRIPEHPRLHLRHANNMKLTYRRVHGTCQ